MRALLEIRSHPISCIRSADDRQTWLTATSALRPKRASYQISSIKTSAEHDSSSGMCIRGEQCLDNLEGAGMMYIYGCAYYSVGWWVVSSARGEQRQTRTKSVPPRHSLLLAYFRRTSSWQTSEAAVSER